MDAETVEELLRKWQTGDKDAEARLFEGLYDELRRYGAEVLLNWGVDKCGTFSATDLVQSAYVRFTTKDRRIDLQNHAHFMATIGKVMGRIVRERVRAKGAQKAGAGLKEVTLSGLAVGNHPTTAAEVSIALKKLWELEPKRAEIFDLRYFGGLTEEEAAQVLNVAKVTVARGYRTAKVFLRAELSDSSES